MKILVLNSGSSSLKYDLYEMDSEESLISGLLDRIGLKESIHVWELPGSEKVSKPLYLPDHRTAFDEMFSVLLQTRLTSLDEVRATAHRVVHGGRFRTSVVITPEVIDEIRRMTPFFPLHHPAQIIEIEECLLRIPEAVHVATFDTSFHSAIPDEAAVYGLPFRYFHEKNYRRTGFHGHSHAYVSSAAATYLNRDPDELKLITCHLGNGCSVAAVRNGKSIDTSLGMTACEGLIMGTRCGDVDPGLMPIIMREESLSTSDVERMLYHESGLYGLSGISRDMREIENAALKGQKRAELALKAFCYKVKRYIGSMLMVLGGCDAIIFTGGIGTNSSTVRSLALAHSESLGFVLDEDLNRTHEPFTPDRSIMDVSSKESPIRILIAQTNEEIVMARECIRVLNEWKQPGELDN